MVVQGQHMNVGGVPKCIFPFKLQFRRAFIEIDDSITLLKDNFQQKTSQRCDVRSIFMKHDDKNWKSEAKMVFLGVKLIILGIMLAILVVKLAILGAKLGTLGAMFASLGAKLAILGAILAPMFAPVGSKRPPSGVLKVSFFELCRSFAPRAPKCSQKAPKKLPKCSPK